MSTYQEFLDGRMRMWPEHGVRVEPETLHPALFDFQRDIVRWALAKGRCAIFADTGLGKTLMQLEWARRAGKRALILAPLAVARQTIREAARWGIDAGYAPEMTAAPGIVVTNYERLEKFEPEAFDAVVLDESSILKNYQGATRTAIIEAFKHTPMRLACTATPAPNDIAEIANHAEFLGVMSRSGMLATFFVHDDEGWRLKRPAAAVFYRWLASWGIHLKSPADLGYDASRYELPTLDVELVTVETGYVPDGQLFATHLRGVSDRARVRKATIVTRVAQALEIVYDEKGLHASVDHTEPRENSRIQASYQGKKKRPQEGTVCPGPKTERAGKGRRQEMAEREPGETQGAEVEESWDNDGPISGHADGAGREMRDLRSRRPVNSECIPASGPLPQNEKGPGSALSQLQPGTREVQGQSDPTDRSRHVSDEPWVIWCGMNDEQDALAKALGDRAFSVHGSLSSEEKERRIIGWLDGERPILISKVDICGFGLNMQRCSRMVFVGLSDSYESYYQAIRRCWRFGQTQPVKAYVVLSELEGAIYQNVLRKQTDAETLSRNLITNLAGVEMEELHGTKHQTDHYTTDDASGDGWRLMLGDSAERLSEVQDASVDMSIFSPPFATLYQYSNSPRDLGNAGDNADFWTHFGYISRELLRVMKPGRNVCVHVANLATTKATNGTIGLYDFRGATIQHFVGAGFVYHGEVCIDKDPQAQAIRTHAKGLLFVQKGKDSAWLRPALADYIVIFRSPGENAVPVESDLTNNEWIEWARPIWYGIRESDTLNRAEGREQEDERHICPLQLGTIERCIRLWSNRGETVLSPFAGIGSEGYQALMIGRRFVGCELKASYFQAAVRNLQRANQATAPLLASLTEVPK